MCMHTHTHTHTRVHALHAHAYTQCSHSAISCEGVLLTKNEVNLYQMIYQERDRSETTAYRLPTFILACSIKTRLSTCCMILVFLGCTYVYEEKLIQSISLYRVIVYVGVL